MDTPGERERRLVRAVHQAQRTRRMLRAGGIDPDGLSDHGRRILAWLADCDPPTVDGLVELLTAAHRAGVAAATNQPEQREQRAPGRGDHDRADSVTRRLDDLERRPPDPELGL